MITHDEKLQEWEDKYRPIINPHNPDGSWNGMMFETYGVEYEMVRETIDRAGAEYVWTWVDGDDGSYLVAGHALVNRIGYFLTEVPWKDITESVLVDLWEEEL